MKRFFLFAFVATLFAACSTDPTQDLAPEIPTAPDELQVSFDEEDTRIQLGENGCPVWNENDLVSVFYKSDGNDCYKFTGKTGDREGTLKRTGVGEWSRRGDNVVVVYPYSKSYIISLSANTVEASLPAEQTYAKNSYGIGSSLMIAMGDYKQFALKNVCGWLKLQFTGTGYVSKIVLRGNNGEQVAGNMLVCADDASCILAEASADIDEDEVGGALIADDDILTSVTLNCGEGVALNPQTPTAFYIALPPQTFEKGLTAIMYNQDGIPKEISTKNAITIERNHIVPMTSAEIKLLPATNQIWYTSSNGEIVEPTYTDHFFGATIVSNTYENGQGVITFDKDVTMIGDLVFSEPNNANGHKLTSVILPNSIIYIGNGAFLGCSLLTSFVIPQNLTTIKRDTFGGCTSITSITIPDSVTTIEHSAFLGCTALKAFYGKFASADNRCLIVNGVLNSFAPAGLTEYIIPNSVTEIEEWAFGNCQLQKIAIPRSVTSIKDSAFANCHSLQYVNITDLEAWCKIDFFDGHANPLCYANNLYLNGDLVENLVIPSTITELKNYAFYGTSCLKLITIPDSVTKIGACAFRSCFKLTSVTIPDSVTTIGEGAFDNCTSLISVTIPDSVTTIGNYAFDSCDALTSVTIGNSVTTIGESAFRYCYSLKEVYCKPTTPPSLGYYDVFYSNASGRKIYVPKESLSVYKSAGGWSEYASAIEPYEF